MPTIGEVLEHHRQDLLAIPGCTAVSIGKKAVAGQRTATDCIVVHVSRKGSPREPGTEVPLQVEGVPTDVVEREFNFALTGTDPMERFDPVIGGISITSREDPGPFGSTGCFIRADGTVGNVTAGAYLLTNEHVVAVAAQPLGGDVIQPGDVNGNIPGNYGLGIVVASARDATHDCAIVRIVGRDFRNEVPNHPWHWGNREIKGIGNAAVNNRVYKFGAKTGHTVGTVTNIAFTTPGNRVTNAIVIQGEDNGVWCDGGDSGSVVIRYDDDLVIGLNFQGDTGTPVKGGYGEGLAYDISTQIQPFSTNIQLA